MPEPAALIVLDRDGVINFDSDDYVRSADEWRPLPGSLEAIARLHAHGFKIVVVSNQSGIGRGLFTEAALEAIHAKMRRAVEAAGGALDGVYYCPHRPDEGCDCRKPAPGLLRRIERDLGVDLRGVPFIGDKRSDVLAAQAVGARPILVRSGKGEDASDLAGTEIYADLAEAVDHLLESRLKPLPQKQAVQPRRNAASGMRAWLGSLVFTTLMFGSVAVYGLLVVLGGLLGHRCAYRMVRWWVDATLVLLEYCCGLKYEVEGLDRLPQENTVVLLKHSSAWETIAQIKIFPMQTWVIKRELMWAPVLGWVLMQLKPIAIDRRAGRSAVQQVIEAGSRRLAEGLWVMIFPEGTRVPAGQVRRYGMSGALLASAVGRPIVPVAHNAGDFWPRRGLLKKAGTIRMVIGPPVPTAGRDPRAINDDVQRWIEATLREIRGG